MNVSRVVHFASIILEAFFIIIRFFLLHVVAVGIACVLLEAVFVLVCVLLAVGVVGS